MHWAYKWGLMVTGLMIYILLNQFGPILFAMHGTEETALLSVIGTWVGSIGSVGALIGAIWIASWQTRIQQREKLALAVIQAAHCQHRIQAMLKGLESIALLLGPSAEPTVPINNRILALETIKGFDYIRNDELSALVPLHGKCALKIAAIQSAIGNLDRHIRAIGTTEPLTINYQRLVTLDVDGAYYAAQIAETQVHRMWEVMDVIRRATTASQL